MCLNETNSTVPIAKNLSEKFPLQNGLKQADVLSESVSNFSLKYAIKRVKENQERLKLNGKHQIFGYAGDVNMVGENIDTIKNTEALLDASKDVRLEVNTEKTRYMSVNQKIE
jgi:hypothetical protein